MSFPFMRNMAADCKNLYRTNRTHRTSRTHGTYRAHGPHWTPRTDRTYGTRWSRSHHSIRFRNNGCLDRHYSWVGQHRKFDRIWKRCFKHQFSGRNHKPWGHIEFFPYHSAFRNHYCCRSQFFRHNGHSAFRNGYDPRSIVYRHFSIQQRIFAYSRHAHYINAINHLSHLPSPKRQRHHHRINVPVNAGDRMLMAFFITTSSLSIAASVTGYASAGVAIS